MKGRLTIPALRLGAVLLGALACSLIAEAPASAAAAGDAKRGAYIFAAGDCENCHTDKKAKGPFLGGVVFR